ncbi:hypothetical protein C8R43DRAFT_902649 [Mycena crocata]|nr:hypothetical protein C8R43DRAFT_902649 [Mycena crocata]
MVQRLQAMEDRGWIGIAEREPLRALAALLKAREGKTVFKDEKDSGIESTGFAQAASQAAAGCNDVEPSRVNYTIDPALELPSAKLSTLTQAIAYAGIKELREAVLRKATDNNVKQIQLAVQLNFKRLPTPAQIWKSIRHKDFSRQVRNFLWKSIHSAHRIGAFWKHIPECEEWATCQYCGETEDLEHILLKCFRPGQALVWSLAKDLWLKKHPSWPELTLGSILGCGLASFADEKGRHLPGATCLFRILISESIFVIWKNRNDCVIKRQGQPVHENTIHNKWVHALNQRLQLDCGLTNYAKFGKQNAIKSSLVLQTWSSTLLNEDELPEFWIREPRVVVGTAPKSSHPPLQPSGRGGRNR